MIYTSYFANLKNVINPIAICGGSPDWYTGKQYKKLAPRWLFFKDYKDGKITSDEYVVLYNELVLSKLDPQIVLNELIALNDNNDTFTMICYEKPTDFCHRHIVADWLSSNLGITICETSKIKEIDDRFLYLDLL
jgi:hypothetical protein